MAHDKDKDQDGKAPDDANELPELTDLDLPAFPESGVGLAATDTPDAVFGSDDLPDFGDPADLPDYAPPEPSPLGVVERADLPGLSGLVPTAETASSLGDLPVPEAEPASLAEDDPTDNYEPVAPASGWLEVPTAAGPGGDDDAPAAESSDIFAGGPVARAEAASDLSDVSDVLATPRGVKGRRAPDPDPDPEDLPIAEEIEGFDDDASVFDAPALGSSRLSDLPELPGEVYDDEPEYGATPPHTQDASNILADLARSDVDFDHEASGVRLDNPGMDRTLTDEPAPGGTTDGTAVERVPRQFQTRTPQPTDWKQQSGSDLFGGSKTVPDDDDAVDPFTPDPPDQPSLGSAQSSIFSGGRDSGRRPRA